MEEIKRNGNKSRETEIGNVSWNKKGTGLCTLLQEQVRVMMKVAGERGTELFPFVV